MYVRLLKISGWPLFGMELILDQLVFLQGELMFVRIYFYCFTHMHAHKILKREFGYIGLWKPFAWRFFGDLFD